MRRCLVVCALLAGCGLQDKKEGPKPEPEAPREPGTYYTCSYTFTPDSAPTRKTEVKLVLDGEKLRASSVYSIAGTPAVTSTNSRDVVGDEHCVVIDVSHYALVLHKGAEPKAHFYNTVTRQQVDLSCEVK